MHRRLCLPGAPWPRPLATHAPYPHPPILAQVCKVEGEAAKVSVRHARKAAMDAAKAAPSEDARKRAEREVQRLTDDFIGQASAGGGGAEGSQHRLVVPLQACPLRPACLPAPAPRSSGPQVESLIARKEESIRQHNS